jgi:hypothetical protein
MASTGIGSILAEELRAKIRKMYCIKGQRKSRYSSLNSNFVFCCKLQKTSRGQIHRPEAWPKPGPPRENVHGLWAVSGSYVGETRGCGGSASLL